MKNIKSYTLFFLLLLLQPVVFSSPILNNHNPSKKEKSVKGSKNNHFASLKLGKYLLFSGIPSMTIGRFEIKEGGHYMVALSSDEDSYASGTYIYHANDNTIEWKTGFFWQKRYQGKIVNSAAGNYRIEFDKVTFGEKDDK